MTRFVGTPLRGVEFSSPSDEALSSRVNGDSVPRLRIDAGGRITWSTGSATGDTKLYRSDVNTLITEGVFSASGGLVTLTTSGSPTASLPDGALAIDTQNSIFYFRSNGEWNQVTGGGGAGITVSDTAPLFPEEGDLWFDSINGTTYIRYDNFWVDLNGTETTVPGLGDLDNVNFGIVSNNDVAMYNASTSDWENTQITLGTNTVGSYVESLVAGTGVSLSNNSGEGSTPTIAIGQNVAITSSVTFASVTAPLIGNADTASSLKVARSIALGGDLSGSVAFDGSSDITLNATVVNSGVSLDEISDVAITAPEEFQGLSYNGTNWINSYVPVVSYVRNAEATTITTGTCVYLFGGNGDHASVKRADNSSDTTSSKTIGVAGANIPASNNGPIVTRGYVDGINLSTGYAVGDVLWLGENGAFTTTKPIAPDHLVFIGVVVRASVNGIIYVATQNGYELNELHDVKTNGKADKDVLMWNTSSSVWVNEQINLGTDTVGNYMADVIGGTGVTVSHTQGEGSSASISIGQAVSTTSSVTFARVTANEIYGRARDSEIRFLMEVF